VANGPDANPRGSPRSCAIRQRALALVMCRSRVIPAAKRKDTNNAWKTGAVDSGRPDPTTPRRSSPSGEPAIGPDYDPQARPGDNLYTNSVVALNIDTGKWPETLRRTTLGLRRGRRAHAADTTVNGRSRRS
jgi:alcohol dehydrogenase (cytochrome c)